MTERRKGGQSLHRERNHTLFVISLPKIARECVGKSATMTKTRRRVDFCTSEGLLNLPASVFLELMRLRSCQSLARPDACGEEPQRFDCRSLGSSRDGRRLWRINFQNPAPTRPTRVGSEVFRSIAQTEKVARPEMSFDGQKSPRWRICVGFVDVSSKSLAISGSQILTKVRFLAESEDFFLARNFLWEHPVGER